LLNRSNIASVSLACAISKPLTALSLSKPKLTNTFVLFFAAVRSFQKRIH
jgi:hypothetical protein